MRVNRPVALWRTCGIKLVCLLMCVFPLVAISDDLISSQTDASTLVNIVGNAYDPNSGLLLYRELHLPSQRDEKGQDFQQVDYQTPSGRLFAQKKLTYISSPEGYRYHPQMQQINFDNGHLLKLAWRGSNPTKTDTSVWQLQRRNQHIGPIDTLELPSRSGWVVDAGFDAWMLENWSNLKTGEAQTFSFLALTRARWVQLRAKRSQCQSDRPLPTSDQRQSLDRVLTCITVEPKNLVLRWLVDAIHLTYEEVADVRLRGAVTPRLVRFSGLGNLTDKQGEGMKVVIDYVYAEPQKLVVQ